MVVVPGKYRTGEFLSGTRNVYMVLCEVIFILYVLLTSTGLPWSKLKKTLAASSATENEK